MKSIESTGNVKLLTNNLTIKQTKKRDRDPMSKNQVRCYRLLQWTWGLPQTLCGSVVYLRYHNNPHAPYHGALVTVWPHRSSVSLGMYIFVSEHLIRKQRTTHNRRSFTEEPAVQRIVMHEYGHTIQSLMTGPLYLAVVGLPSLIWNQSPAMERLRRKKKRSYYSVYPEKQADRLGERVLRKTTVNRASDEKKQVKPLP
ncbi:MAG: hypothetical protein IJ112_02575 [Oscillospiraceae bacterium]|nr:hypothetical protein [Oscillospiraceae bacterium]